MKKEKSNIASPLSSRRIEVLSHYYRIDYEKRLVYVDIHFETASEMLESNFGRLDSPMFKTEVIEKIADVYPKIPFDYKTNIEFHIDDYEGYEPSDLLNRFNEALELKNYLSQKEKRKRWVQAALLLVAGLAVLAFMGFGTVNRWFGETGSETSSLWVEVLDIVGWVFIWEAVTVLFLEPDKLHLMGIRIFSRTNAISFFNKDGKEPLASEDAKGIVAKWEDEGRVAKIGKISLLLSSSAFIAIGIATMFIAISSVGSVPLTPYEIASTLIVVALFFLTDLGAGIAGILRYADKGGKRAFTIPFMVLIFLQLLIYIAVSVVYESWRFTAPSILTFLAQGGYIFGTIVDVFRHSPRKRK